LATSAWLLTGGALLLAIWALVHARGLARRVERLSESYWELRYECGQLRSQIARLETQTGISEAGVRPPRPEGPGQTAFVPLSSLKKS